MKKKGRNGHSAAGHFLRTKKSYQKTRNGEIDCKRPRKSENGAKKG